MRKIADVDKVHELCDKLAQQIRTTIDDHPNQTWALVGVRSRGDVLAQRIANILAPKIFENRVGVVDITLYRDDLSEIGASAIVKTTEIDFSMDDVHVVLVDDVLMSGRSIRAALQSLMDLGRPRRIWLSVLVDRGGRELPIAPDHIGWDLKNEDTSLADDELVIVKLKPHNDEDAVYIQTRGEKGHAS